MFDTTQPERCFNEASVNVDLQNLDVVLLLKTNFLKQGELNNLKKRFY